MELKDNIKYYVADYEHSDWIILDGIEREQYNAIEEQIQKAQIILDGIES